MSEYYSNHNAKEWVDMTAEEQEGLIEILTGELCDRLDYMISQLSVLTEFPQRAALLQLLKNAKDLLPPSDDEV